MITFFCAVLLLVYVHYRTKPHNDLDCKLEAINKSLTTITNNQNKIMATLQELETKVDELQVALDAEQQSIAEAIAALTQTITDLQALVADGGTVEQRQAIADKLDALKADLEGTV